MNKEQLINDLNSLFDSFLESKEIDLNNTKLTTNRFNSIMMYLYDSYVSKLQITNNRGIKQYSYIDFINLVEWYISKCLYLDLITLYGFCLLVNISLSQLRLLKFADDVELKSMFIFDIDNNSSVDNIYNNNNSVCDSNNIFNKNSSGIDNIYIDSGLEEAAISEENATALCKSSIQKLFETVTQSTVNKLNDSTLGLIANANNNNDIGLNYAKERIEAQAKARQTISISDLPLLE